MDSGRLPLLWFWSGHSFGSQVTLWFFGHSLLLVLGLVLVLVPGQSLPLGLGHGSA